MVEVVHSSIRITSILRVIVNGLYCCIDMPSLTNVTLNEFVFEYKDDITVMGGTCFITRSIIDIGELYLYVPFPSNDYCMSILEGSDEITDLIIGAYVCPFENVTELDLSAYPKLKHLRMGSHGFIYVSELKIIGLNELETVVIETNSFAAEDGHFYLKDCPKLKTLRVGDNSFPSFTVIEIENVDALEVIDLDHSTFVPASLELKSILIHSE